MPHWVRPFFVTLFIAALSAVALPSEHSKPDALRLVSLLQYIAGDYAAAVKGHDPAEEAEQKSLITNAMEQANQLTDLPSAQLDLLKSIKARVDVSADVEGVTGDCTSLALNLIS